ncbi:type II toxin-antitoxin system RelE/ParE family toxin [Sphingomonas sp.]|uniref:type II toxin-antitoxin system RelE/ParE family toxin n=1 Tax=Sphingomonas sp. TaxID=28214 RepID=UPI003CC60F00
MTRTIVWRPKARADLLYLYDWIAEQAGDRTALDYTSRIEDQTSSLTQSPERGSPRDDLAPGARTTVYRRRTIIIYRVLPGIIEILRVAHRGRDLGRLFVEEE